MMSPIDKLTPDRLNSVLRYGLLSLRERGRELNDVGIISIATILHNLPGILFNSKSGDDYADSVKFWLGSSVSSVPGGEKWLLKVLEQTPDAPSDDGPGN